jgi:nucleoside-diphosphate-sugar epimerase
MSVVAITGGTGFIGSHVVRDLIARGHLVRLIGRTSHSRDVEYRDHSRVSMVKADLTNETALQEAFSGCDAVCHLAGINRERQAGDYQKVHIEGTAQVVAASVKAEIKKLVFVSFIRARSTRTSGYLNSKWEAEECVRNSPLDYTIVKPGMIYGKGDQMVSSIVHGLNLFPVIGFWPSVGFIEKAVNPIFVDDFVRILVAALVENRLSRQTVAVAGPDHITLIKAVDRVARVMKKPMFPVPMPILIQYMMAYALERICAEPLFSVAQVRMLSEGMSEALPESDLLPSDLIPKTYFCEESIRRSFAFTNGTMKARLSSS